MKFLRGLAISLLSFILFLALMVFSVVFLLKSTLLTPDFVVAQADKLPIASLMQEFVAEQLKGQSPVAAELPMEMNKLIEQVISEQEPWLKEQVRAGIYTFYDFLLGKSEGLSLVIPLETLKQSLRDSLRQVFQQNLPPQLAGLPPNTSEQYFEEFYRQFAGQIPSEFRFEESLIPPEAMAQIRQVRQYVSYLLTGYYGLISLMVLLVLGIILLNRGVKGATRGLGINFLIYGGLEFTGVWVVRNFLPTFLPLPNIPASLQPWLTGVINDFVMPMQTLGIGLAVAGMVLIVISVVYRGRRVAE